MKRGPHRNSAPRPSAASTNPDHPFLREIQHALAMDPSLPMKFFLSKGIGQATIRAWVDSGWITFVRIRAPAKHRATIEEAQNANPGTGRGRIIRFGEDWKPGDGQSWQRGHGIASGLRDI